MIPIYEGLNNLISAGSYIHTKEYKELYQKYEDACDKYFKLSDEINNLSNEDKYKPKSEWDDMEQFMYDNFGDKPASNKLKQLRIDRDKYQSLMNDLSDKLKSIKNKSKSNTKFYKDLPTKTNKISFKGFTTSSTGMSYYDNFLNEKDLQYMQDKKGETGYIAEMSPIEYLERCANIFNSTFESQIQATDINAIEKYAKMMDNGKQFHMPVLNYSTFTQEGRHRAQAAYLNEYDTIPVLIITKY